LIVQLNLELPFDQVRPIRVRDLQESALCFSYDKRGLHFLVDRFEENVRVILLNGDHAFHSYNIERVHDWKGLAVTDYELVVDVESAIDTENRWPPLGALSLSSVGPQLQVAITNGYGLTDEESLRLGMKGPLVSPGLQATFTRWGFQLGNKDRPQHFWVQSALIDAVA
jgi:hypothetical protein